MVQIDYFTDMHLLSPRTLADEDGGLAAQRLWRNNTLRAAEEFVRFAKRNKPDMVIGGGDQITTTPWADADADTQSELQQILVPIRGNTELLPGNADVRHFNRAALSEKYKYVSGTKVVEYQAATVILWAANVDPQAMPQIPGLKAKFYEAEKAEIADLKKHLGAAKRDRPVLLFTHIPVNNDAAVSYVDDLEKRNPHRSYYQNHDEIINTLVKSGQSIVVFSGHRHLNRNNRITHNVRVVTMDRMVRHTAKPHRKEGVNYASIKVSNARNVMVQRYGVEPVRIHFSF